MGEIGVCWEGTRVRGCLATPRLHGVYRRIIKWAASFRILIRISNALRSGQVNALDNSLDNSSLTFTLLSYSYMTPQPFGDPEQFTAGYMQATCRLSLPLVLIPMYKKEETPAHFGAGVP